MLPTSSWPKSEESRKKGITQYEKAGIGMSYEQINGDWYPQMGHSSNLKKQAARLSKKLIPMYLTTHCHTPQECTVTFHSPQP
jgi:hypothetical protein